MKTAQKRTGVITLIVAGLLIWSGFGYAAYTGKLNGYQPLYLATCTGMTIVNPGCWIGYGLSLWRARSSRELDRKKCAAS
jgi:hypothetical protein